jgi:RNA polymerase sigma-70 factor (ECF subfamily)
VVFGNYKGEADFGRIMTNDAERKQELIRRARDGDVQALGELMDEYRAYLRVIAQRHLPARLDSRLDASDVVQQTMLSVHRYIEQFLGTHEAEFVAWMRQILERNVQEAIRNHIGVKKRAVGREQALDAGSPSSGQTGFTPIAREPSPSQRAMLGDDAVRLARALERLPEEQREAVRLRHLEGQSLLEIATILEKSPVAVAGLLKRGLQGLRKHLIHDGAGGAK